MGYRGRDDWRDMSDYVVHFTKPPKRTRPVPDPPRPANPGRLSLKELVEHIRTDQARDTTGYTQMMSILYSGELTPGPAPLGAARKLSELGDSQRVVCFSEIPLDMLGRLVERRSRYGIGFRKDVLVGKGGTPLWYVDRESPQAAAVREIIQAKVGEGIDLDDPFWTLTPFIDHPGVYNSRPYRFEWEREWRVAAEVKFTPEEVAFLFIPEEHHEDARQFFADAHIEHSGPVYDCAYIDPAWSIEQIEKAVESVPPLPDPRPSAVPWWFDHSDW
jgi:Putative abortive phage resistance protein AbiGi, antitoxin